MSVSEADVRAVPAGVHDPDLRRSVIELGMVRQVRVKRRSATVELALPMPGWPVQDELVSQVVAALGQLPGVGDVRVERADMDDAEKARLRAVLAEPPLPIPNIVRRSIPASNRRSAIDATTL